MNGNISTLPYFIQIKESVESVIMPADLHNLVNLGLSNLTPLNTLENPQICFEAPSLEAPTREQPCVVQVVYPEDLNLGTPVIVKGMKRGRPRKKKCEKSQHVQLKIDEKIPKNARTRSGRLVKLPKHIEKDFKKIEISTEDHELKMSDFKRFDEKENSTIEFTQLEQRKRTISAQYRCPKCSKAYLGKVKMIQHLKKNPDHGPLPEGLKQEYNFDVWNYLFDITQKCKPGQRGGKFCEELSNLLHNVQLLKSALFKKCTKDTDDDDNSVQIDKVLGNAIGLSPGKYKFHENELYKDVTVLKLITNSEFFKPTNVTTKTTTQKVDDHADSGNSRVKSDVDNSRISLSGELLADNLLLAPRSSVDELILSEVDHGSTLLDNSTSSDEVINVDQFVNERFKKLVGPEEMELDLPALELFQFHTT